MLVRSSRVEFEDSMTIDSGLDETGGVRPLRVVVWGGREVALPLVGAPFGIGLREATRSSSPKVVADALTLSVETPWSCLSEASANALRRETYLRMAGDMLKKCSVCC